jgi:hypothetical protein
LRIRLVKKLAEVLNDVDLTDRTVGQIFDCPEHEGRMLILEGWAESVGAAPADLRELSASDNGSFENAQLSQSVWQLIDDHREGKKDKLAR